MENYKRAIAELQKAIDKETGEVRDALRKLGEHLSYQDSGILPDPAMHELHGRIQELRRQLPESRQEVKRILQAVSGNEALQKEIRVRTLQINELSARNQELYETIGRAAYRGYRDHPASGSEIAELFESLEKQEEGLAELEQERKALEEHGREGKFFRIFRETGRSVYLKGLLSLRRRAASRAYREVGTRISSSPRLIETMGDRRLQEALAPFQANQRKINTLQQELDDLQIDQEKKWSELKHLGAHRSHQKRVREIESEIRQIEAKLQELFEGLGTHFRTSKPSDLQDAEAAGLIHEIEAGERGIREKAKRSQRLNAAVRIEVLNNQLGGLADKISRLEGEIDARRRDVETLRTQVTAGEKEIQRLKKIRGSSQSLLDGEGD